MTTKDLHTRPAAQADLFERFGGGREPRHPSAHYPHAPGARHTDTSLAASAAAAPDAATLRARVLDDLEYHGPSTTDETAHRLRLSILSIRPRFSELRKMALISDTTRRRPNSSGRNAIVWARL